MNSTSQLDRTPAREAQVTARNMRLEDLRVLMSSEVGRRFVWCFLEDARVFYESESTDPHVILSDRGRRSFALHVWRNLGRNFLAQRQLMERENLQCS